jgi:hypothetical protein
MTITNSMEMDLAAKFTGTEDCILAGRPCFMTRRIITCVALSVWIGLSFNGSILQAATLPTVDEVLQELNLSDTVSRALMGPYITGLYKTLRDKTEKKQ